MAGGSDVKKIYHNVVQDVCSAVREALLEEGYDDHTLQELRTLWSARLDASKALEPLSTSAVDEATTRNNRRTTTNEANHPSNFSIKSNNIGRPHVTTAGVMATSAGSYINPTNSSNATMIGPNTIGGISGMTATMRTQQLNRPQFNQSPMGNNPMRTSNQLDGCTDECDSSKPNSRRSKPRRKLKNVQISFQLDGTGPAITDDEDDEDDNEVEGNEVSEGLDDDDDDEANEEGKEDPNPLCSDDDVSEDEPAELFESDNVVVCQYEKISRTKNKWRFTLKSGVMSINGRDYVFSKAMGEADW